MVIQGDMWKDGKEIWIMFNIGRMEEKREGINIER